MELVPIKGDTWYLDGAEHIPLVRLEGGRCILLDSGHGFEGAGLAASLDRAGLRPLGVFCSHAHRDHAGNNAFLRERYGAWICLPFGEAALSASLPMYKSLYPSFSPRKLTAAIGHILGPVDQTVAFEESHVTFCGVPLQVVHTPGHTPDHICTITPDGVLYTADALMDGEDLAKARLPYHAYHEEARRSMEKLRRVSCGCYVAAHRGVGTDLVSLVNENLAMLDRLCGVLLDLAEEPLSMDQLCLAYYRRMRLMTTHVEKASLYSGSVHAMAEYLVDMGQMNLTVREGLRYFQRL